MNRRDFFEKGMLAGTAAASVAAGAGRLSAPAATNVAKKPYQGGMSPWPICLDTATIRPAEGLREKVRIADEADYDAIEPWMRDLEAYEKQGGDLKEIGREIRDRGLFVPSVIGLWGAIPTHREAFEKALDENRERMRRAAEVGAEHVQTIPAGEGDMDLGWAAEAYREILEVGLEEYGVNPAMVFVEMFTIKRLSQAAAIAIDANHPAAKIIPDVFHMYIGNSGFEGLRHLRGDFFAIFQFNDAPAEPAREELTDEHRVFPGDGILPLTDVLKDLQATGYDGCVSLELYNPDYWERDPMQVAKTGLRKTVAVIDEAVG